MKMNLQLFGYDDGFYYGQCKLICETETVSGNGKTVTISGNGRTWSGTVADKLCSFLVPGRGQYTISLMNGGTTLWSGTVEAGYGECIHVMLADGYEAVMEKSKLTLAEIEASVGSLADYVPDADCVKTLNNNLGGVQFRISNNNLQYSDDGIHWINLETKPYLWENTNPNVAFNAQTIQGDFSNIDTLYIKANYATYPQEPHRVFTITKGVIYTMEIQQENNYTRTVSFNDTGITFGNAMNGTSVANVTVIPVKISSKSIT